MALIGTPFESANVNTPLVKGTSSNEILWSIVSFWFVGTKTVSTNELPLKISSLAKAVLRSSFPKLKEREVTGYRGKSMIRLLVSVSLRTASPWLPIDAVPKLSTNRSDSVSESLKLTNSESILTKPFGLKPWSLLSNVIVTAVPESALPIIPKITNAAPAVTIDSFLIEVEVTIKFRTTFLRTKFYILK